MRPLKGWTSQRVQRKVVRQAVNRALTPTLKAARNAAPEDTGLLRESLAKKTKTYADTGTIVGIVGPDKETQGTDAEGKPRVPWRYAHLVEDGHVAPDGTVVPPHPFMRPAFDSTEEEMKQVMTERLAAGIEKEAAKL